VEDSGLTLQVLKNKTEITDARKSMVRLGVDCADGALGLILKRLHILRGPVIGDRVKSWDVLHTANFIFDRLRKDDPILDIGAYASEILPALGKKGFTSLVGIDLNPDIKTMPDADRINYQVGDYYGGAFAAESFSAITAISVIEHGFAPHQLLSEVSRLLRPGGYFIASVDYWPEKIDTSGIMAFGLDWIIFSRSDIQNLIDEADRFGLRPVGELDFAAVNPLISWHGKSYTFAWFCLQKTEDAV
jgi:SAM-dependent methyltransferase